MNRDERNAMIRELRYKDGLTCNQTAMLASSNINTVQKVAPGRPGKVPNSAVRALFEEARSERGLSASEVARRMGWRSGRSVDASRVLQTLGLRESIGTAGRRQYRTLIDAETAGLLAEAMGYQAWEANPE
jgi:hypothetical protein